ncbi:hypothetical protein Rcae01_05827 [Novipirellula caenicola]|uniref:Uncharacterized protein n=1 Tax=Novipirellula caenicola TaxID=1536901 RepID=A0ABP9VYX8_9BACT
MLMALAARTVRMQRVTRSILTGRRTPLRYENHPVGAKVDGIGIGIPAYGSPLRFAFGFNQQAVGDVR